MDTPLPSYAVRCYKTTCLKCGHTRPTTREDNSPCPVCLGKSKDDTIADLRARVAQLEQEVAVLRQSAPRNPAPASPPADGSAPTRIGWRVQCLTGACTHQWEVPAAVSLACPVCKGKIYSLGTAVIKGG